MKKHYSDVFFIIFQVLDVSLKNYNKVLKRCDNRERKVGNNYGSEYIRMHVYYYQKFYEKSFYSFSVMIKNYRLKIETIDWGIKLFIETPIVRENNLTLAKSRIFVLKQNDNLSVNHQKLLDSILKYIENSNCPGL